MRVLLTGADGFLGSNVVRGLLDRGYTVRGLIQPGRNTQTLANLDVECVQGDILVSEDVIKAAKGCDAIIHAAANTSTWPARSRLLRHVNIRGTRNVVAAAREADVDRFVHVGSANSFGFGSRECPGNETLPYQGARYGIDYFDTKHLAQSYVLQEAKRDGLPAVVVNPTFMIGPYDSKPCFGAMILAVYQGRLPGYAVGGRNYIHVRDVVVGIVNALRKARIGESYILGNQNLSYRAILDTIARTVGVRSPRYMLPPVLTQAWGSLGSLGGLITGRSPALSLTLARLACEEHYYTAEKAVRELKLPQTPIEDAIQEAYAWLKDNLHLGKRVGRLRGVVFGRVRGA